MKPDEATPATKGDLATLEQRFKGGLADANKELKADFTELRQELKGDIVAVKTELKGDIAASRTELDGVDRRLVSVERDVKALQQDVRQLKETTTTVLAIVQQIDQRTKGWQHVPGRAAKLEERVTKLEARIGW